MRESTDLERAYAAGFFDGEGTVIIRYRKPTWQVGRWGRDGERCKGRMVAEQYSPGVSIGNSNLAVLQWLDDIWGGHASPHVQRADFRPMWYWQRTSVPGVYRFLTEVVPYLQIKRPMAEVMLEWLTVTKALRPAAAVAARGEIRRLNKLRI